MTYTLMDIAMFLLVAIVVFVLLFAFLRVVGAYQVVSVGDITDKKVVDSILKENASVITFNGDVYKKYDFLTTLGAEKESTLLAACGNHDSCSKVLKADQENFKSYPISFKFNNTGFLVLNSEDKMSKQKTKAEAILKDFQNDKNIKVIIISDHKPAITNPSAHHKESEAKGFRAQFATWDKTYTKIALLLSGHQHGFQVCSPADINATQVTDGTGGRDPYAWGSVFDDNCKYNLSGKQFNGYTVLEIGNSSISGIHKNVAGGNQSFSVPFP